MKFNKQYILNVLAKALSQGTTPRKLALTCALGTIIGIFPVWGTTTFICIGIAILLRLNVAILQLVNYLLFPLQVILILPFIKAGSYVFDLKPFPYSTEQLVSLFKNDFWIALKESGFALITGVGVWAVISVPLFFAIFFLCFLIFNRWRRKEVSVN